MYDQLFDFHAVMVGLAISVADFPCVLLDRRIINVIFISLKSRTIDI